MYTFALIAPDTRFPANQYWYLKLDLNDTKLVDSLRTFGRWNGDETKLKAEGIKTVFVNRNGGYFIEMGGHKIIETRWHKMLFFPAE